MKILQQLGSVLCPILHSKGRPIPSSSVIWCYNVFALYTNAARMDRRRGDSVTRLLDCVFNTLHLQHWKIAQKHIKLAKEGSKCFQILNELFQNDQSFLTLWQRAKISPNLVTLTGHLKLHRRERIRNSKCKTVYFCFCFFKLLETHLDNKAEWAKWFALIGPCKLVPLKALKR